MKKAARNAIPAAILNVNEFAEVAHENFLVFSSQLYIGLLIKEFEMKTAKILQAPRK